MSAAPDRFGRRCAYCGGPHAVSARVAEESPFCTGCLHERIARRAATHAEVKLVDEGGAVVVRSAQPERRDSRLA